MRRWDRKRPISLSRCLTVAWTDLAVQSGALINEPFALVLPKMSFFGNASCVIASQLPLVRNSGAGSKFNRAGKGSTFHPMIRSSGCSRWFICDNGRSVVPPAVLHVDVATSELGASANKFAMQQI
jgi:hypothetical protein